jgi:hypothetical protein
VQAQSKHVDLNVSFVKDFRDLRGTVEDEASHAAMNGRLDCLANLLSIAYRYMVYCTNF